MSTYFHVPTSRRPEEERATRIMFLLKFQRGRWLAELETLHFLSCPSIFFFHSRNENNNFYEDADRTKRNDRCKGILKVKHSVIIIVALMGMGLEGLCRGY